VSKARGGKKALEEPPEETIAPVRRVASAGDSAEILPETNVLKGYEFEDGRFVTIDPEELKALETQTATQMEVLEFVRLADVDPVYFETSYYVRPEPGGEKPFALLFEALRRAGLVALGRFSMHRREHVTLIRSGRYGLVAHTMFYATEVRADEEFRSDTSLLKENEIKLADTLVRSLTAEFEPEKYHDSYKQKLEALIASKVAGKVGVSAAAPARKMAPVVDLMEALQASLARARKPPATAKTAEASTEGRGRKRTKAS
jgi:DNA end-binding protein Ku